MSESYQANIVTIPDTKLNITYEVDGVKIDSELIVIIRHENIELELKKDNNIFLVPGDILSLSNISVEIIVNKKSLIFAGISGNDFKSKWDLKTNNNPKTMKLPKKIKKKNLVAVHFITFQPEIGISTNLYSFEYKK